MDIESLNNEVGILNKKIVEIETKISKIKAEQEFYEEKLKNDFGITKEQIDSTIKTYQEEIEKMTGMISSKLEELKDYILKLEKIIE